MNVFPNGPHLSPLTSLLLFAGVIALVLLLLVAALVAATKGQMPTPNAAAAQEPPAPVRPRSQTTGPALRVHLCVACATHGVSRPGDICMPCAIGPANRAEEIAREAVKGKAS